MCWSLSSYLLNIILILYCDFVSESATRSKKRITGTCVSAMFEKSAAWVSEINVIIILLKACIRYEL